MFALPILLFITGIMAIVQISLWQMFPKPWREIMFANPIFAFIINLLGSGMIAMFTGVASIVGICNLGASVLFGLYAWWYKEHYKIKGLKIRWLRIFWIIPIFPILGVEYKGSGEKQ